LVQLGEEGYIPSSFFLATFSGVQTLADVALLLDNNSSCLFYRGAVVDVGSCVFGQPRVWRHPSAFSAATRRVATRLEVKVQPWCKLQEDQQAQTVQVISARRVAAASPAQESTAHGAVHEYPGPAFMA